MIDKQQTEQIISKINHVLESVGILDVIRLDSSLYVGGSLPAYIVSQVLNNLDEKIVCNDIDLYTTNYMKTLRNFSKHLGSKIHDIKRTGVNVTFLINDIHQHSSSERIPIQIVTSEFKSFHDEVLGNYDSTLVSVGFHPYKNELIIHNRFLEGLKDKKFIVHYEKSNPKRIDKLTNRALEWFNAEMEVIRLTDNADFRPYYKNSQMINSLQDIVSPPGYIQLYYNKFNCIQCGIQQEHLLCQPCYTKYSYTLGMNQKIVNKKITILGGVNGLGKIIKDITENYGNDVYVTSRNPPKDSTKTFKYVLGEPISDELMNCMLTSDIVILNAYSTLDGDERIWLTTLDTFDEELALSKFKMNTFGYVKFLQEFIKKRKEQIKEHNLEKDISMVFMDANESRYKTKLSDSKHLELNISKCGTKQIFYTNANLLASLGVLCTAYDPGWLSYHAIPVELKESKSKYLIPPDISVLCLLYLLGNINHDEYIEKKKVIFDSSVYKILNKL